MANIENFGVLSEQELREFADALIKTVNSESIFTDETNFNIVELEVDELSGDLYIGLATDDLILVEREASWECYDEDETYSDPGYEADFVASVYDDAKKAFKTLEAEIDGYSLELTIDDIDEEDTDEVIVDSTSHEDAGIGHYEYWGHSEYDSQPYIEVEGTLVKACNIALSLIVGANSEASEPSPEQPE